MKHDKRYDLITFASNRNGSKIFCRFTCNKKNLIKGFYDFDKELFYVTKILYSNLKKEQIEESIVLKELSDALLTEYDWMLYQKD